MSLSGETTRLREQDVRISILLEKKKEEDNAIAIAKWESNIPVKCLAAERKRQAAAFVKNQNSLGNEIREMRRAKLIELYEEDDKKYEEELFERGLTFRKERA